jgi:hypothetical protein
MPGNKKKLSLLDILLSLPTDPSGMMRHLLLERRNPPHTLTALIATLLFLVGPSLYYRHSLGIEMAQPEVEPSLWCAAAVTLLSFILFTTVLLRLLAFPVSVTRVMAATFYSLAGLIPFMVALYLTSFLATGSLTILGYLSTGHYREGDWLVKSFPTWTKVGAAFVLYLFTNAIRALGNTKTISAVAIVIFTIPIMIGAFMVGLTVANAIFPDTGIVDYRFFLSFISPE